MSKSEIIRRIYTIVLSVFIVAMGIALICVAADIYYSGEGPGKIYSPEIVSARLKQLAIPLLILIAAILAGAVFPLVETKAKGTWSSETTLKRLIRRMPAGGETEEFAEAKKQYTTVKIIKIIVWCTALCIALVGAIVTLVYLLDTANFAGGDFVSHMKGLVKIVLPFTLVALAVLCAASILNHYFCKAQMRHLKTMIRFGSKETALPKEVELLDKAGKIASHNVTLWVVRGVVLAIGIIFIILGILNGGAEGVLGKAIKICSECIGIG